MNIPSVSAADIPEGSRIVQGPISISPLEEISPLQKDLDKKLTIELDRLLFREQVGSMYR
jgi:hypothetical protein